MEELTTSQIAELREKLEQLVNEMETEIVTLEDETQPVAQEEVSGRIARTSAIQNQEMAIAKTRRAAGRLKLAHKGLERIEEQDYGLCEECGDPIGYARLSISPETLFCVPCQELKEKI